MKNLISLICTIFIVQNVAAQDVWSPTTVFDPTDSINQIRWANENPIYYRLDADEHYHGYADGTNSEVTESPSIDWLIGSADVSGIDYQIYIEHLGPEFFMRGDDMYLTPVASFEEDDDEIVSDFFPNSTGLSVVLLNHKYDSIYFYCFDLELTLVFEGSAGFDGEYIDIALIDQNNAVLVSGEGEVLHVDYDGGGLVLYEYVLGVDDIIGVERNPSDGQPVLISSNASTDFIFLDLDLGACEIDYIINAPGTIPINCRYDWRDYDCDGDGDLVFHMNTGHTILLESKIAQLEFAFTSDLIYISPVSVDAPIAFVEYNSVGRNEVALAAEIGVMTILRSSNLWCSQAIPTINSRAILEDTMYTIEMADFSTYPSPVTNQFQISGINTADISYIQILDMSGLIVETFSGNQQTYDVSHLPSGTYFVSMMSGDTIGTQKIIKL